MKTYTNMNPTCVSSGKTLPVDRRVSRFLRALDAIDLWLRSFPIYKSEHSHVQNCIIKWNEKSNISSHLKLDEITPALLNPNNGMEPNKQFKWTPDICLAWSVIMQHFAGKIINCTYQQLEQCRCVNRYMHKHIFSNKCLLHFTYKNLWSLTFWCRYFIRLRNNILFTSRLLLLSFLEILASIQWHSTIRRKWWDSCCGGRCCRRQRWRDCRRQSCCYRRWRRSMNIAWQTWIK